jgi:hypothetical protein
MDKALLAAFQRTTYRVRLAGGGWAGIHIGQALPSSLQPLVGTCRWAFITAWNPRSNPQPRAHNRQAQRALLALLQLQPEVEAIRPGLGVGVDGQWCEPSLFVVGPGLATFDHLARRFGQHAYVHGEASTAARLRVLAEV